MDDYEFTHDVTIPGGRVVFPFRNTGSVDQEVVLVALSTDPAPLRQQLASDERLAVETIAVLPARPQGGAGCSPSTSQRGATSSCASSWTPTGVNSKEGV
jgi:hypothetical protein